MKQTSERIPNTVSTQIRYGNSSPFDSRNTRESLRRSSGRSAFQFFSRSDWALPSGANHRTSFTSRSSTPARGQRRLPNHCDATKGWRSSSCRPTVRVLRYAPDASRSSSSSPCSSRCAPKRSAASRTSSRCCVRRWMVGTISSADSTSRPISRPSARKMDCGWSARRFKIYTTANAAWITLSFIDSKESCCCLKILKPELRLRPAIKRRSKSRGASRQSRGNCDRQCEALSAS